MMKEDDLVEIERRLIGSTAGSRSYSKNPWKVAHDLDDGFLVASLGEDPETGDEYYVVTQGVHASELRGSASQDASFIASCPLDVKNLIDEVRRCHRLLENK